MNYIANACDQLTCVWVQQRKQYRVRVPITTISLQNRRSLPAVPNAGNDGIHGNYLKTNVEHLVLLRKHFFDILHKPYLVFRVMLICLVLVRVLRDVKRPTKRHSLMLGSAINPSRGLRMLIQLKHFVFEEVVRGVVEKLHFCHEPVRRETHNFYLTSINYK